MCWIDRKCTLFSKKHKKIPSPNLAILVLEEEETAEPRISGAIRIEVIMCTLAIDLIPLLSKVNGLVE